MGDRESRWGLDWTKDASAVCQSATRTRQGCMTYVCWQSEEEIQRGVWLDDEDKGERSKAGGDDEDDGDEWRVEWERGKEQKSEVR